MTFQVNPVQATSVSTDLTFNTENTTAEISIADSGTHLRIGVNTLTGNICLFTNYNFYGNPVITYIPTQDESTIQSGTTVKIKAIRQLMVFQ